MIFKRDDDDADPVAATAPSADIAGSTRRSRDQGGGMAENNGEVTIVGAGARLEGNVVSAGSLRIDGQVKGQINADGDVTLSPQSQVEADIRAQNVSVAGKFKGNLIVKGEGSSRARADASTATSRRRPSSSRKAASSTVRASWTAAARLPLPHSRAREPSSPRGKGGEPATDREVAAHARHQSGQGRPRTLPYRPRTSQPGRCRRLDCLLPTSAVAP